MLPGVLLWSTSNNLLRSLSHIWCSVGSNETSWDPGEIGADADTWPQLVRPTIMCDDGRWPIWGTDMAHIQSQVMKLPAIARHRMDAIPRDTNVVIQCILVASLWSEVVRNRITSSLRDWEHFGTSVYSCWILTLCYVCCKILFKVRTDL